MKITNTLIEKFLADRCTDEEAEAVYNYCLEHPELMDTILPESEWEEVLASKPQLSKRITKAIRRKWMQMIKKSNYRGNDGKYTRCLSCKWMILSLALLIFLIVLLIKLFNRSQKEVLLSAIC